MGGGWDILEMMGVWVDRIGNGGLLFGRLHLKDGYRDVGGMEHFSLEIQGFVRGWNRDLLNASREKIRTNSRN